MPDRRNLGESFAAWQSEMDAHLKTARRRRLCIRVPFITVICLGVGALLAHWRHGVIVQRYCASPTTVCSNLGDYTTEEFWISWVVAITLSLTVLSVGVALAMLVVRLVPRYGRLLYISGPFQDSDRSSQFVWYFWLVIATTAGLLTLTIIEFLH